MRRIRWRKLSKKAITLVELIVAMALTAIFAGSCVLLILPITKIYTSVNDLSRAQLLADTVIDELRLECSQTYIKSEGDVWISSEMTDEGMPGEDPNGSGKVLVIRRNEGYVEALYSDYNIPATACSEIVQSDEALLTSNITSRAIYRLFSIPESNGSEVSPVPNNTTEVGSGIVHYGYYTFNGKKIGDITYATAEHYYDFTNPVPLAAYSVNHTMFSIGLRFHDVTCSGTGSNQLPAYVLCDVTVKSGDEERYTRSDVVLCFASPE